MKSKAFKTLAASLVALVCASASSYADVVYANGNLNTLSPTAHATGAEHSGN